MEPVRPETAPEQPPRAEAPEAGVEAAPETVQEKPAEEPEEVRERAEPARPAPAYRAIAPATQISKDPILKRVEEILEEDMKETYFSLPPEQKKRFKEKGEEVAAKIQKMIASAKVKAKKVARLIIEWLRIIPQVNRFFLEQEAKIKTDRIMQYAEEQKKQSLE